jgi:putative SOS response-associated peptidase YedK
MCNRYRMTAKQRELAARFGIASPYPEDVTVPPPELFPKKPAWIVRDDHGRRVLDVASWGFPHQVMGASGKMLDKPVTNVRNLASSFWKSALANPERRCLVPVTSFSEYGSVRGADGKLPLHWFSVPSREIFAFAGIWRPVEAGKAFAFLTCEANEVVRPIHEKAMPVILHDEDFDGWLSGEYDSVCALAAPYPSQLMTQSSIAEEPQA